MKNVLDLSIITTMYYSAPHIEEFYSRIVAAAEATDLRFELIFVDDGSPDNSLQIALELCEQDERVRVVELSKNFGHHPAIMTGLAQGRGELFFLIDCDLEEQPEWLGHFSSELRTAKADVVYGVQDLRKGGLGERLSGSFFYSVFNVISPCAIPRNPTVARLMTRQYVDALLQHAEREIMLSGLFALAGFRQIPLSVVKKSKGSSTYTMGKKIALMVNGVTSFSTAPLVFVFYLGLIIFIFSTLFFFYRIFIFYLRDAIMPGYTTIAASIWILGGLTIFSVGLVGIYVSRVFSEVKQRPRTIVKKVHSGANTGDASHDDH
ncbi:glycosyltransferase family 2 protein [Thermodesulfobacteriota bacterium]